MEVRCVIVMCLMVLHAVSSTEASIGTCGCACGKTKACCGKESPKPFYEYVPNLGYYKLHTSQKTWYEAKAVCEKEGAHLAVIDSEEELEALQELRRRMPAFFGGEEDDHCFIGLKDDCKWSTVTGEILDSVQISKWVHDDINGGILENCGFLVVSKGILEKGPCTVKRGFFCEANCLI